MVQLYEPQVRAVTRLTEALLSGPAALNASHTGTGKTLVNLTVARQLGRIPLIVAPLAAHGTWDYWSRELGVPCAAVVNCERLRMGSTPWVQVEGKGKSARFLWKLDREQNMVIWDEIHRGLSGAKTVSGNMAAMLRPQGIPTLLASATPFSSPLNMRASGYLLGLHKFNSGDFFRWCRANGAMLSPYHSGLVFDHHAPSAKVHLERINQQLKSRMVRLTIEDLAEHFKGNLVEPALIRLSERSLEEANRIYAEMDREIRKANHANPLTEQLRARQRVELLKLPAMAELVQDSLEEGYAVFVALGFLDSLDSMVECLEALGIRDVVTYSGAMGKAEREVSVAAFTAGVARVFLGTIQAGGMSISLHHTREDQRPRTSLMSPTFSASDLVQCLGRIHRAEALTPVVQRIVLAAGTIEEKVARRVDRKITAIGTLTDADLRGDGDDGP